MAQFLKHASSGRIYPWTEALAERVDMLPYSGPDPFAKGRKAVGQKPQTVEEAPKQQPDPRVAEQQRIAEIKARYEAEFERPPHPNMKPETMEARLAEAEAERIMKAEQVPIPDRPDDSEDDSEGAFGFGEDAETNEA